MGKMLTEKGLGGGPDGIALLQLIHTAMGDPGALGCEALHMVLLLLQEALRNQKGHIHILNALFFEFLVHDILNIFPDSISVGAVNKHALDRRIVDQLRLGAHIGEPLGEIDLHIGDLLYLFLLGHIVSSPLIGFVGQISFPVSKFPYIVPYLSRVCTRKPGNYFVRPLYFREIFGILEPFKRKRRFPP